MTISVDPSVFGLFPGMRIVVARAEDVANDVPRPEVETLWAEAWRQAGEEGKRYPNAQSHPRVAPWRARMKAAGISPKEFPSSIEAMLRRAIKGGEPFAVNPLVDFYNVVSLRHVVPAGAFDLDGGEPIELRFTRLGDTFRALGSEETVAVPPGEIAYACGSTVLTRHFVWRQSVQAAIQPESRRILLVSEILGEIEPEVAEAVAGDFRDGMERLFGVTVTADLLHAGKTAL